MAKKIGLSEEEYSSLISTLEKKQASITEELENFRKEINELNSQSGGFYTENVTPNLKQLLNTVKSIEKQMNSVYKQEKKVINNYLKAVDNIDTCK